MGAAAQLCHSLCSGCPEEPGLGDPGTSAAAGPWLGVGVRDQRRLPWPVGAVPTGRPLRGRTKAAATGVRLRLA